MIRDFPCGGTDILYPQMGAIWSSEVAGTTTAPGRFDRGPSLLISSRRVVAMRGRGGLAYDRRRGTHLLETRRQWLRSGCSTAETARVLFLERQSMHSRLTRIFELIGGDPRGRRG